MKKLKTFFSILKKAFSSFSEDNVFKMSASLSYYTIFSMGPLLVIVISLAGIFYGKDAVEGKLYGQLQGLVGSEAAIQIQNIIRNVQSESQGWIGAIIGLGVLIIGATTVFTEMQDSINRIWSVKAKPKKGWLKFLKNRLLSFSLIVSLGFLLLVSLVLSALLDVLSDYLKAFLADYTVVLFFIINFAVIFIIISSLFAIIFKVLPDAHIAWKDAFVGAGFTAVLFLLGKTGISIYLGNSNLGVTYGAAASIVIILTWVYYSSLILYFGAEFTKAYAITVGKGIKPNETAVYIINRESKEIDPDVKPKKMA